MDFFMKQQSITLNVNCQLIQCTHITDLLANLKVLIDSMIIKVFSDAKCLIFTDVPKSSNIHLSCSLVHNFHICNNNYLAIYT